MTNFTRQMEDAAHQQLREALAQGLTGDACVDAATTAIGREHRALVERVWRERFGVMGGAG